jgi:hypothetical protein
MANRKQLKISKSISCSAREWGEVKQRAAAAGYDSASRWLVEQAVTTSAADLKSMPQNSPDEPGLDHSAKLELYSQLEDLMKSMDDLGAPVEVGEWGLTMRQMIRGIFLMLQHQMEKDSEIEAMRAIERRVGSDEILADLRGTGLEQIIGKRFFKG